MQFIRLLILITSGLLTVVCLAQQRPGEGYVGSGQCASCHRKEFTLWQGSHHDLAMQEAAPGTVLGNFDNSSFSYFGAVTRFYRRNGDFFVKTQGANGEDREFKVLYTFGVEPLQQYLVSLPGGRLQALTVAWDSRAKAQGGQRWFHLQPDERIAHTDELHWTGTYFNWNSRCAECHSTNLQKHFSLAENRFDTTWSEIDVACEACHGPGAKHLQWASGGGKQGASSGTKQKASSGTKQKASSGTKQKASSGGKQEASGIGLLPLRNAGVWRSIAGLNTAGMVAPAPQSGQHAVNQIDMCAHCHSRRVTTTEQFFGQPFLETHALQLLDEGIYHPDGQILEENYVYGSFIQSKMFHQGVVCSNCHEPHSLELRQPGNQVCTQCHSAPVFDTPKHHFHREGGSGADCANCHMPETTYMVVDDRRDHSLRVPRPDLSIALDVPNACNQCHTDRDAKWAAAAVESWYPKSRLRGDHFGQALAAGRSGDAGGPEKLLQLAAAGPGIARATAVGLLQYYPSQQSLDTVVASLSDADPLVRVAALQALTMLPLEQRFPFAGPLLTDASPRVRAEAGRILAGTPATTLSQVQKLQLQQAVDAYIESLLVNADMANNHLNLAALYQQQGEWEKVEAAFKTALKVDGKSVLAMLNLADWYRQKGSDWRGEALLQKALRVSPGNAAAHHSLGLFYVRQKKLPQALVHLEKAAELAPRVVRYGYVYSVALNSTGETAKALKVVRRALQQQPNNRELLALQASFSQKLGRRETD